jgi:hypothetical protein
MWSGTGVYPVSWCSFSSTVGLYGDTRIGSKSLTWAHRRSVDLLFPQPRLIDRLSLPVVDLLTFFRRTGKRPESCDSPRKSVCPSFYNQCPNDQRHLICQSDGNLHAWFTRQHTRQPGIFVPRRAAQHTTAMAPIMSIRRISRWPTFDVRPKTSLPPVECCQGVKPSMQQNLGRCQTPPLAE